ncbi:MAG: phosphate signaling complex protein PhoU [Oscillospiraceae bacterium]|nr:phosphate signaling complex protein PhoU [Oscillospiraceae bacterium]
MRNRFDEQLEVLNSHLIELGTFIEQIISLATMALIELDPTLVEKVIEVDNEIDLKEKEIETLCMKLLLRQQPVASDLRLISSALKMITDMERIGDQSHDIAKISTFLNDKEYVKQITKIPQMAEATIKMVTDSVNAFVMRDLDLALSVIEYDSVVDGLFGEVRRELIHLIKTENDKGELALDLLMISKYFERIGDHAENIAGWVAYAITGEHKDA